MAYDPKKPLHEDLPEEDWPEWLRRMKAPLEQKKKLLRNYGIAARKEAASKPVKEILAELRSPEREAEFLASLSPAQRRRYLRMQQGLPEEPEDGSDLF